MAYVALTSLMATLELQFLQPIPRVSLLLDDDDEEEVPIKSFFQNLSSLREFLDIFEFGSAPRDVDLETKIRDFALEAEDNIEIQLSNFLLLLPKHNSTASHQKQASQQLRRALREAAENAAQLLNITNIVKDEETERKKTCDALTSLIREIHECCFLSEFRDELHHYPTLMEPLIQNLSSLREFVEISNFRGAAAIKIKDLATKIEDFALKAVYLVEDSVEPRQTLEEVAENTAELLNSINNTTNQTQPPIQPDGSSLRCSEDTIMVGHQNDVTAIKDRLFSSVTGVSVISIIGMPGIGKTTLARTIFEDQLVTQHFQLKVWLTMPQKYNEIQIVRDLLESITLLAEQHEIKQGRNLTEMVRRCLKHKRYLIVLDDVWNIQQWDYIDNCLPYVEGSRILLTTRFYTVAEDIRSFKGNHLVMGL